MIQIPRHRWEIISELIVMNGYKIVVEVGASRGDMARGVLRTLEPIRYNLDRYFLIDLPDNMKVSEAYYYNPEMLKSRKEIQRIFKPSLEAVSMFEDNTLDFVFLDGDHSEQAFIPEMKAWWTKLRIGGIICGDEYLAPLNHSCHYRTDILHKMFAEINHHPEVRPSEGSMTYMWWVKKGIIYET